MIYVQSFLLLYLFVLINFRLLLDNKIGNMHYPGETEVLCVLNWKSRVAMWYMHSVYFLDRIEVKLSG